MSVLWLCGPSCVGKSAVGYALFRATEAAAYLDLAQISFCRNGSDQVAALNLLALWTGFRAAGARHLIVTGNAPAYTLPGEEVLLYRLHADREQLTERVLARGRGEGPPIPGDDLRGLHREALLDFAARAAAQPCPAPGARWVDTNGRSVAEVVAEIRDRTE